MLCRKLRFVGCSIWLAASIGCIPTYPENIEVDPPPRSLLQEIDGTVFSTEIGLDNALRLDVDRPDGTGKLGGYISNDDINNGGLIILLHGASTFFPGGSTADARQFLISFGKPYHQAGYKTFSLDFQECGSAYGREDVRDLIAFLDWLEAGGKTILGVDRVYTLGYSVGATMAIVANRQRQVTAVASISGITEPRQMQQWWPLYQLAVNFYPNNVGLCQVGSTLAAYGLPGSPGWDTLNTVAHIDELKSPMIVIQGTEDQIFHISNARNLQTAYQNAVSSNIILPPVTFVYLEGVDHFDSSIDPATTQAIITFFDQFKP